MALRARRWGTDRRLWNLIRSRNTRFRGDSDKEIMLSATRFMVRLGQHALPPSSPAFDVPALDKRANGLITTNFCRSVGAHSRPVFSYARPARWGNGPFQRRMHPSNQVKGSEIERNLLKANEISYVWKHISWLLWPSNDCSVLREHPP